MSLSPIWSLTNSQADIGSPFPIPHFCPQSPQQTPPSNVQSQEVDAGIVWDDYLHGTDVFPFEPEPGVIPPCLPDNGVVEHYPAYNLHTPSVIDFPLPYRLTASEFDEGSTPSLIDSPRTVAPMMWQSCICGCDSGPCLFQRPYRRPKGDPLEDGLRGELITFQVHGRCGIPLRDALRCKYSGLSGRDDPMFYGSKTSISIRIELPDCPSWAQQMRTKDWKRKPSPITKSKLTTEVAKKVNRFLKDMSRNRRGSQEDPLSPSRVDFDRLVLVALEHVSLASWQPHLRLI